MLPPSAVCGEETAAMDGTPDAEIVILLETGMSQSGREPRFAAVQRLGIFVGDRISAYGRVKMWRGGLRYGLSVTAPFVWRCLNS